MATEATASSRPHFPARAVVTAGMPYGNKNLHFGHIVGVFVPADFFARYDHVFLHNPPQAGPIAFHGLRPDFVARFGSALAFCEHLAQSAGVLLLPGNVYDMDAPYVRMGYGRANFAENLAVLDGWLQQNG